MKDGQRHLGILVIFRMSSWLMFLKRPYPLINGVREKFIWALSFAAYVFLFFFIFKPFGFAKYDPISLLGLASAFSAITFSVMFLNLLLLPYLFSGFFHEERWSIGREIFMTLVHIFLIGLMNFIFARLVYELSMSISHYLYVQFITLILAIVPVSIWTLLVENQLLKRRISQANLINNTLGVLEATNKVSLLPLTISSESNSESETFDANQIYFITSSDNYIKIGFYESSGLRIKILRNSLKNVEKDLKKFKMFYRCHRAYIVNLQKVESVRGNARGLKLRLINCDIEIPVSRVLNKKVENLLKRDLAN